MIKPTPPDAPEPEGEEDVDENQVAFMIMYIMLGCLGFIIIAVSLVLVYKYFKSNNTSEFDEPYWQFYSYIRNILGFLSV